jgi:hypothetical protein
MKALLVSGSVVLHPCIKNSGSCPPVSYRINEPKVGKAAVNEKAFNADTSRQLLHCQTGK